MDKRCDDIIRFFIYVLIFWLPISKAAVEICVIGALMVWLFKRLFALKHSPGLKKLALEKSPLDGYIVFFIFACLMSTAGSLFPLSSLKNFVTKTLEWFAVFYLVLEVFKKKEHFFTAFVLLLISGVLISVDGAIQQHVTHIDFLRRHVIEPGAAATASFDTPNGLGGYLAVCIPVILSVLFIPQIASVKRVILVTSLVLMVWVLGLTSARAAWIGFGSGVFVVVGILFPLVKESRLNVIIVLLILLFISVGVVYAYRPLFFGADPVNTIGWRWDLWMNALAMISDRPFWGHGIHSFMKISQAYDVHARINPTYAHNSLLQLAVEVGMVGMTSFVLMVNQLLHTSYLVIRKFKGNLSALQFLYIGFMGGTISFLAHSLFDNSFYTLQLSVFFWIVVGLIVALARLLNEGGVVPAA